MSRTLAEVREYIEAHFDPDDLVEIFEINTEELLDRFEDKMIYYMYKFEEEIEAHEFGPEYEES